MGVQIYPWHEEKDDEAYTAWVRDFFEALQPHSEPGGYVNFMSGDDTEMSTESYGPLLERLKAVKRAYDPANLFRLNQNIAP